MAGSLRGSLCWLSPSITIFDTYLTQGIAEVPSLIPMAAIGNTLIILWIIDAQLAKEHFFTVNLNLILMLNEPGPVKTSNH